ncbi:MAG: DUF2281 domain-containing protein [Tunicatimonas sp.]|uniref:type II toxin-antitoxin system VapB family antitoxin n=1 Tax=Tunicatimonas sp. TaxID=1940096 RepID=UPI003C78270D
MTDIDIYTKLVTLPNDLKDEVGNYVDFLKSKVQGKGEVKTSRKAGLAKGLIRMRKDFDEPLDDFKEYME